jgi:hypothetical protein
MNRRSTRPLRLAWALVALVLPCLETSAHAQRTALSSAGSLAADDPNPAIERSSGVLMLRGATRGQMGGTLGGFVFADLTTLTTAMTTTGLVDPAAKAALGLGPRDWRKVVRIEVTPVGNQAVKLSVSVNPEAADNPQADPAGRLFRELVNRAKAVIDQSVQGRRAELKTRVDELEKRRAEAKAKSDALRKRLNEAETVTNTAMMFNSLPNRRRQLEAELETKRARLKAIETVGPKVTADDELGKALKELVTAREAVVTVLAELVPQARAQPQDLFKARAELAEARVQAAQGGRTPFSGPWRNFRDERPSLEVDVLTLEAQLKAMPEDAARPSPEDAQALRNDLFRDEGEVRSLETQLQQARREIEQMEQAPSLVLLDGQPG